MNAPDLNNPIERNNHLNKLVDLAAKAVEAGENLGYCTSCLAERDCVEPDAENYECEECGSLKVFGAEQIILIFG